MRLHYFIGEFDFGGDQIEIKDKELANQVANVLRLKAGDSIILGDGKMSEATVIIEEVSSSKVRAKIVKRSKNTTEPDVYCVLYCAILKRENFELVAQKATEAGVGEIVPIITERTVKTGLKQERLEKIIKEAAEQSGRGVMPILREPVNLTEAFDLAKENGINIIFDKGGERLDLDIKCPTPLGHLMSRSGKAGIFIGPEGGWTEEELAIAKEEGLHAASLGRLTLRAETAAIVAVYLMTNFSNRV